MLSLTKALEARNERLRNDEKGFTLIELLVVVIIIGILAAIAIPIFLGQQDQAKNSAATSDLANAKVIYVSSLVDNIAGDQTLAGFTKSPNVTSVIVKPSSVGGTFCIDAVSTATGAPKFSINGTGGVLKVACP